MLFTYLAILSQLIALLVNSSVFFTTHGTAGTCMAPMGAIKSMCIYSM